MKKREKGKGKEKEKEKVERKRSKTHDCSRPHKGDENTGTYIVSIKESRPPRER